MALIENDVFIEDFELTRESGQSQSQQAQGLGLCLELDQPPMKGMRFSVHRIFHGVWEAIIRTFARQYFRMFSLHNLVHKSFSS